MPATNCTDTCARYRLSGQQAQAFAQTEDCLVARVACHLRLDGPLDPERLREAIGRQVRLHESLRTTISRGNGEPLQTVHESGDFVWRIDGDPPPEVEQAFSLWAELGRLDGDRHTLALSVPAVCADRASLLQLCHAIGQAYADGSMVEEEILQWTDVLAWQEELLAGPDVAASRNFWDSRRRLLETNSWRPPLTNRLDAAPAVQPMDDGFDARAAEFARAEGVTIRDVFLGAWLAFLFRVGNLQPAAVAVEFDGRNHAELAGVIGPFARSIPFQAALDSATAFRTLLASVKEEATQIRDWQDVYPADCEIAGLPAFDYFEVPESRLYGDLKITPVGFDSWRPPHPLRLSVLAGGGQLQWELDGGEGWNSCFRTLLLAAIESPETPVGRLPLLDQEMRRRILTDWNRTDSWYPRDRCIHELFAEQAERTPERVAVRCGDRSLTYGDLNCRANQLAHYLRKLGVGADCRVGLCLDRRPELIVGLLAILKAGAAYLPLHPEHPPERLLQQLEGAAALVTEQKLLRLFASFPVRAIALDSGDAPWVDCPASNPGPDAMPENPAYVLFTSGSTGVPKGVAVRHRNLVNYSWFARKLLRLEAFPEGLHFGMVSTICADVGNTCIYPALLSGGCLHLIPYEIATDSRRMAEYCSRFRLDVLKIVPSHLAALLDGGGPAVLPARFLVVGGEKLRRDLVRQVRTAAPECQIVNHYAPTETTVGSLTLAVNDFDWEGWDSARPIPLGRPIANTQLYVLDANREPVPPGVLGELYIAGDGVSAGYVGRPDLTEQRFLPNPFSPDPAVRMYRSGDLVRYLPDGVVEFVDRIDDQVKIRGFRVELGEVQAVLHRHAAVKQAVVLARDDERGDKRLVAYVAPHPGAPIDAVALTAFAKNHLPDYMVPAAIVVMAKLPLNANGKVDRQTLPDPESRPVNARAPERGMEETVAAIWEEVLKRDGIGADEDFFEAGGHSLLATQMAARLRDRLGVPIAVRMIFEHPTIARLSKAVEQARREELGLVPPPVTPISRSGALPLSFAQERLWVLDQLEPNDPTYNVARALRIRGALNLAAFENAINEIIRRHESQRTTYAVEDGRPVQRISPELRISPALRDLTSLPEEAREPEARRLAQEAAKRVFDLRAGPLLRVELFRLATEDHVALIVTHHIVSDAWSASIFFAELAVLYDAFCEGRPSPLPELRVHYADYAAHERAWLQGGALERHLAWWREQLAEAPPILELPLDRPRSAACSNEGACETIAIPAEVLAELKRFCRQEGATLFTVLLAAFQGLLSRLSGQQRIVVGTDVANRNSAETEAMMGFFVNLLAIHTDCSGNPTFRELVRRVRGTLLGAYAHQELPFARIVEELQPERRASQNPIVQALFVLQNAPAAERRLSGVVIDGFPLPIMASKFDLGVFMAERQGGLTGFWVYRTGLFDRSTIQRLGGQFEAFLRNATERPDTHLSALEVKSEEQKQSDAFSGQRRKETQAKRLAGTMPKPLQLPVESRQAPAIDLGKFRITLVQAGVYYQDGGCLFGILPKRRWAELIRPNAANLVLLGINCYVVETGAHTVLIDTGAGVRVDPSPEQDGGVVAPTPLPELLMQAGIDPEKVDVVINSHLHWDHCGGNITTRGGALAPAFPNAKYYCAKGEFAHALSLHPRDAASYLPGNFVTLAKNGRLKLVEGEYEPVSGIRLCPAPGHNRHMMAVLAQSEERTFCCFSDLVPTSAHLMPTWTAAFDLFPLESIATKSEWISRAAREHWVCGFGHDPKIAFATVTEQFRIAEDLSA